MEKKYALFSWTFEKEGLDISEMFVGWYTKDKLIPEVVRVIEGKCITDEETPEDEVYFEVLDENFNTVRIFTGYDVGEVVNHAPEFVVKTDKIIK